MLLLAIYRNLGEAASARDRGGGVGGLFSFSVESSVPLPGGRGSEWETDVLMAVPE
jgi:hypothetical protein